MKSFLMPKTLHFPESQPPADRLAISQLFIANLSVLSPPIKSKQSGAHYYQVHFQSEEFITHHELHLQNCGNDFFSV